ncbi:hypothetical protein [Sphingobacterium faecale]|uniref:Uncharacterized protein n=1 Tax=Sphingobacterium faecale TaxID=2803775 RepID=A0ABS1R970_9SPHI|nr:hypothetical protein [Sphingobacterium faecale]MBL1411075.1 hypothetical protein [Sphingobacterium faecale]
MNPFTVVISLILFGLTVFCFVLPFKAGEKQTANVVGLILTIVISVTLVGNLGLLVIFVWPIVLMFQFIFISYWSFKLFNRKKVGLFVALALTGTFGALILSPWISDWLFNKNDARKILSTHGIDLKDDFILLKNEAGGFRDYYEIFTLKLSDNDFDRIAVQIKNSKNYKGIFKDGSDLPFAEYSLLDTVDFETENIMVREYWIDKTKMANGTYHFRFQLNKKKRELTYIGSDE